MSGWTWPSSPGTAGWTVSMELHVYVAAAADMNTNALTATTTRTTPMTMIGVRNRCRSDGSS